MLIYISQIIIKDIAFQKKFGNMIKHIISFGSCNLIQVLGRNGLIIVVIVVLII